MKHLFPILLAEDDENDVFLLRRAFQDAEIRNPLYVARDGQEVIDWLAGTNEFSDRSKHPVPCLLILDLKMPRKSGMDVLEWRRRHPALKCLPVLVFSSSAHPYDIEKAYGLGANAFVVKPADNEERARFVRNVKGFWLQFNEPPVICSEGLSAAQKIHAELEVSPTFL
jgi:CheY-like chemotaxis protein